MRLRARLTMLGLAIAAAVVVFPLVAVASAEGPDYLEVTAHASKLQGKKGIKLAKLSLTTKAAIPKRPDNFINTNPAAGFAWLDSDTNKAFVVTIHPQSAKDHRLPAKKWHAHTVTLAGGAMAPNDFCVASIDSNPMAAIQIHRQTLRVNVQSKRLPIAVSAIDSAVGFTLQNDTGCASGKAVRTST